jgi:hypothetical protein
MMPIWTDRTDGPWLYVEQAVATSLDRPYRQRVYRLVVHPGGAIHSVVYKLPDDPLRYAGAWRDAEPLANLSPKELTVLEGCDVVLSRRSAEVFAGGTVAKECANTWRGASYATSEVTVKETEMISWDRGYAPDGQQVWGATGGGYIFKKIASSGNML